MRLMMQWMATAGQMCPFSPPKTKKTAIATLRSLDATTQASLRG